MYQKTGNIKSQSIFSRAGLAAVITAGVMVSPLWLSSGAALASDRNQTNQDAAASTSMHESMSMDGKSSPNPAPASTAMDHGSMSMSGDSMSMNHKDMSAGSREMHESMMNGMQDMSMTGNTDQDFVMMMIKHHQSGIDMARIQMKYGKDDKARHMAEETIAAQQKEIHQLEDWQDTHK